MIDLRSDTVTRPSDGMRRAMADAEVGDDVYGEDPSVNALQEQVAGLFGHEAALFVPTGTMGNQLGLRALVAPGQELLCCADAHIVTYEHGAAAMHGGISTRTWNSPPSGVLDPAAVVAMVRADDGHTLPTTAVAVENTHNRGSGSVQPLAALQSLADAVRPLGIGLHCDGARIWNAHVASGVPLATYGGLFDTVSVCLSKGLGAPVGSLLVSSAERIAAAHTMRKRLGGGMRQAGVLAAAGTYALAHQLDRLAEDHDNARLIAAAVGVDPASVHTNIVVAPVADAAAFERAAHSEGVLLNAVGAHSVRLVTHLDVTAVQAKQAGDVLARLHVA